jgi:uncharacterized membrane protein YfcA
MTIPVTLGSLAGAALAAIFPPHYLSEVIIAAVVIAFFSWWPT